VGVSISGAAIGLIAGGLLTSYADCAGCSS